MALSLIRLHNQFFTISQNCCFFLVLQWWRNKCLKACCEHQAAHFLCIQGGWVLIIHEVIWHNQSPLIQVFVSGKLFFLLCMQHTATNLSSTLRLLFYASSVHVISASSYLFLHLQAGHKYKFWLLWRLKKENFCSNAIVSNQHWGVKMSELEQNHYGVFNSGQFLLPTAMLYNGLRLLPFQELLPGNTVQEIQASRWTTRVTFKKSEVSKWRTKSRKNDTCFVTGVL